MGAERDKDAIRKASANWLAVFSEDAVERGQKGAGEGEGEGGEIIEGGDIKDPSLEGFWSEDEEGMEGEGGDE